MKTQLDTNSTFERLFARTIQVTHVHARNEQHLSLICWCHFTKASHGIIKQWLKF